MIIHKSLDNSNNFLITNVDYELLTIMYSSLLYKQKSISQIIKKTESLITEYSDKKIILQLKKEVLYFQDLEKRLDDSINTIKMTLENI